MSSVTSAAIQVLLADAAGRAGRYLAGLDQRPVAPDEAALAGLARLELSRCRSWPGTRPPRWRCWMRRDPRRPWPARAAGTSASSTGGSHCRPRWRPAWLAAAWDQNAALPVMSPAAARLHEVATGWLTDLLGLPRGQRRGVRDRGGHGQHRRAWPRPAIEQLARRRLGRAEPRAVRGAGADRDRRGRAHSTLIKALGLVGFGRKRVVRVPVDFQGRMRADALPAVDARTVVCAQAGNVNSGAFDPIARICERAHSQGAWVHVDGAFGMWAAAAPARAHLARGVEDADSWATDTHKWLNVPYDSGLVFARNAEALRNAMSVGGAYLAQDEDRVPYQYTPDFSRRARGIEVWAALRQLGRPGLADLIERTCRYAGQFADGLRAAGYRVLNDVVLNQVLVSFGSAERTREVIARVQRDGTCWCGGTVWQGHAAMRISISGWATTSDDISKSADAIIAAAQRLDQQ